MKYLLIIIATIFLFGCPPDPEIDAGPEPDTATATFIEFDAGDLDASVSPVLTPSEAIIALAILNASVVTVDIDQVEMNGIVSPIVSLGDEDWVATKHLGITTGCFGLPACVRMTEKNRGIIKDSLDDFVLYGDDDYYLPGSVTYFMDTFYEKYWANFNSVAMNALILAQGYGDKRNAFCVIHPDKCGEGDL